MNAGEAVEALVEGRPQVLMHTCQLYASVMKDARLTHCAVLENTGVIPVVPRK